MDGFNRAWRFIVLLSSTDKFYHKDMLYRQSYQSVQKAVRCVFFQRLRDLQEDRDLRQEDVAEILGISQTVYSRY